MGLKSPLTPAKFTMSASVMVRASDSHSWPTSTSSKKRCCEVNDMAPLPAGLHFHTGESTETGGSSARVSRSRQQPHRPPLGRVDVDTDVDDLSLGDVQHLVAALGLDGHLHRDRGFANPLQAGGKSH